MSGLKNIDRCPNCKCWLDWTVRHNCTSCGTRLCDKCQCPKCNPDYNTKTEEANEYIKHRKDVLEVLTDEDTTYLPEYAGLKLDKLVESYCQAHLKEIRQDIERKRNIVMGKTTGPVTSLVNDVLKQVLKIIDNELKTNTN